MRLIGSFQTMTTQGRATSVVSSMSGSTIVGVSSAPIDPGGPGLSPGGIAEMVSDPPQHAVHEPSGIIGRVALGQVDGFADRDPEGNVRTPAELEHGDTQQVPVDDRHAVDRSPV